MTGRDGHQLEQGVGQRRLAGSRLADQAERPVSVKLERHPVHRGSAAVHVGTDAADPDT